MILANKVYIYLFLFVPFVLVLSFLGFWIKKNRVKKFIGNFVLLDLFPDYDSYRKYVKLFLNVFVLIFLIISLIDPKFGKKESLIKRRGSDVIIAIDTSMSMLAEDIKPNRMTIAKAELGNLIDKLSANRIGLIAFAGESILECPLTLDYNAVKMFLDFVDVNTVPIQGTDISKVINLSINTFDKKEKSYKVLILLTDGEDHDSAWHKKVEEAKKEGIKIFTIGIGNRQGEMIPIRDESGKLIEYKKDKYGQNVLSKLDENLLIEISKKTGGEYYYSKTGILDTNLIMTDIDNVEKKALSSNLIEQYEHRYYYFLIVAIFLFLINLFIKETKKYE